MAKAINARSRSKTIAIDRMTFVAKGAMSSPIVANRDLAATAADFNEKGGASALPRSSTIPPDGAAKRGAGYPQKAAAAKVRVFSRFHQLPCSFPGLAKEYRYSTARIWRGGLIREWIRGEKTECI